MKQVFKTIFLFSSFSFIFFFCLSFVQNEDKVISYIVDPQKQPIEFYWKDEQKKIIGSIQNLKKTIDAKNKMLVFAMNGGMYMEDQSPLGLFIQNQSKLFSLNTKSGKGNFYLKPNGVFYITTDNQAVICTSSGFKYTKEIKYATQSGPMLLIEGVIHPEFKEGSQNLNIRNGVGILPDNRIIFAMSKESINFYDFATYFKELGCKNALYLDEFVSRMYCPEKNWTQTDGNFGVIIGVTK